MPNLVDRAGGPARYLGRRVLWLVPVVGVALLVTFALMHAAPGSPWDLGGADQGAGGQPGARPASPEMIRALDEQYGLDRPWWVQFGKYLVDAARLDFGPSYQYPGRSAGEVLLQGWAQTAVLGLLTCAVVLPAGVLLGLLAARRRNSVTDRLVTALASACGAVPNVVVAVLLIAGLSVGLYRLTGGAFFLPDSGFGLDAHLVLPVITLGLLPFAVLVRLTRASALETLAEPFVQSARARGLPEHRVMLHHALPSTLIPVITALGPLLVLLVTGSVVTETVFQIPGMGNAFLEAVTVRDYPVIMAGTVVYATLFGVASIAVDVLLAVVDPRVALR